VQFFLYKIPRKKRIAPNLVNDDVDDGLSMSPVNVLYERPGRFVESGGFLKLWRLAVGKSDKKTHVGKHRSSIVTPVGHGAPKVGRYNAAEVDGGSESG